MRFWNFIKRLFNRSYIDIQKIEQLKKAGIEPVF